MKIKQIESKCNWNIPKRTCENCPPKEKAECVAYLLSLEEEEIAYYEAQLVLKIEFPEKYYTGDEIIVLAETASQHREEAIEKYYHWGSEEIKDYLSPEDYEIFIDYCEAFQLERTHHAEEQVRWLLGEMIPYDSPFKKRLIAVYDNVWFYNR